MLDFLMTKAECFLCLTRPKILKICGCLSRKINNVFAICVACKYHVLSRLRSMPDLVIEYGFCQKTKLHMFYPALNVPSLICCYISQMTKVKLFSKSSSYRKKYIQQSLYNLTLPQSGPPVIQPVDQGSLGMPMSPFKSLCVDVCEREGNSWPRK